MSRSTANETLLCDFGVDGKAAGRELSLAEAHLAAAKVQAQAIYSFVGVLALGGLVVLLAILYESHSWRQTVWKVAEDAGVAESQAWRGVIKTALDKLPHWPIG